MYKILIVHDNFQTYEVLERYLSKELFQFSYVNCSKEAYYLIDQTKFDLLIIKSDMPIIDGYNLVKLIRLHNKEIVILMIDENGSEPKELKAFQLGVDDYIKKPFSYRLLLERLKCLLRRSKYTIEDYKMIVLENIILDLDTYKTIVNDRIIKLTRKEFDIFKILVRNPDKVISREYFLNQIWGYSYYGDTRVIDCHIKNIRKKTGLSNIRTINGFGYKLETKKII